MKLKKIHFFGKQKQNGPQKNEYFKTVNPKYFFAKILGISIISILSPFLGDLFSRYF
jgi:hypothetical protein